MKKQSTCLSISWSLLFMLIVLQGIPTIAQEVEDEREFDYIKGSGRGPEHWGNLHEDWEACSNGSMQSPIDMSSLRVKIIKKSRVLKRNYKPSNATVRNRGHDISVQWHGEAGSIDIDGTEYFLQQAHWHSPSEHSINGRRYDLELHMVHSGRDSSGENKTAVVGLLYKLGQPDKFLSRLTRNISAMTDRMGERNLGVTDPREIKMRGKFYYRYMGSLTVPPCTEGVIWTINKKVMTVSRDQVMLLREAVHDYAERNARPLQPINSRDVHLYGF